MSLDLLQLVVQRLGVSESCEAMANFSLKVATLTTCLSKAFAEQDSSRERLDSEILKLKMLLDKTQREFGISPQRKKKLLMLVSRRLLRI